MLRITPHRHLVRFDGLFVPSTVAVADKLSSMTGFVYGKCGKRDCFLCACVSVRLYVLTNVEIEMAVGDGGKAHRTGVPVEMR